MAAQYIPIKRISTLDTPIKAEKLDGSLFTTENQAHEFIISVRKNGVKQAVTGSVSGKFIRANGTTIFLQGSVSNGDAVVRLHQDCYNVQGRFTFNIFNTQSGVTTCIYSAVGKIDMGSTETVIDAGDVVPDVSDVVAAQEAAQAAITAANTAAQTANTAAQTVGSIVARPYSSSSTYTAGDYCTNNGNLYKANQDISTAEEWTASHWTQIVMGDEVTSLKSAIMQDANYSNSASVTANTYKYVLINIALKKGQRVKLYVSESQALQENDTNLAVFGTDQELFKRTKLYNEVEYTLTKDCAYVDVYIPAQLVIANGTATLNLVVYSVNRRLLDVERDLSEAQENIQTNTTNIAKVDGKIETNDVLSESISVTAGTQVTKDINHSFKKGQRISLLLSGSSGTVSTTDTYFFIDPTYAITYPVANYNVPVEFTLPSDTSKIRCNIGANRALSNGTVTFSVTILSVNSRLSETESRLDTDEARLTSVYNDFTKYDLPSYYFASSYIQNKMTRINTLAKAAAGYGDSFIFITDEHWTQNAKKSPNLIRYISDNCHIRNVISGGDTGEGGSDAFCRLLSDAWDKGTVHHATGNHEYYSGGNNSNLYYMMDMQNNDEVGNPQEHYYCFDNIQAKIRYIVLNSDGTSAWGDTQLAWFEDAMNVEAGWGIIIIVHWMYMINWGTNAISLGSSAPLEFVDAINNYTGNGEIIGVFQGHVHRDRMTYTKTNGTPVIITTSDKYVKSESGGNYDIDVTREAGTITEQAFDVVIVDRSTKTLTMVRIGGLARDGIGDDPGDTVEERTIQWN